MKSLDRFFDLYDRVTPRWFGDAAALLILIGAVALILG